MGLMAIAAISGIGSAFAFNKAPNKNAQTYYAVQNSAGFAWTTNLPAGVSCGESQTAVCTIVTENAPEDNKIPASHLQDARGMYQAL